jgi:lysophospholipase L1-like esterase
MKKSLVLLLLLVLALSCSKEPPNIQLGPYDADQNTDEGETNTVDTDSTTTGNGSNNNDVEPDNEPDLYSILSLGDSYTIGESVCSSCRFPEQLKDSLSNRYEDTEYNLNVIAQTGWTTTNLLNAIASANLTEDYDLVTLLIGVNNQYQNKPFSLYEFEFPQLIDKSIEAAEGDTSKVIVISIPDYAFTPFGQGQGNQEVTSDEIDQYNTYAEAYCNQMGISYVYITDITRQGLDNTDLVASDGLHPSALAYSKFVERILPLAIEKLELQ